MTTVDGFEIITNDHAILNALIESKEKGTMIGIHAITLGTGTHITSIVDVIVNDYETTIVTKGYDIGGYFFTKSALKLDEIKSVVPFTSIFINPFMKLDKRI